MPQFLTLGETMACFVPEGPGPLRYVKGFSLRTAGAESNAAVGMQKLGISSGWISRLGADEFGQYVLHAVRGEGVDCSRVALDPEFPTGLMFKETGGVETSVTYYRKDSAASRLSPGDLDLAYLAEARLLHLTGITPVLSESCRETVLSALELARNGGTAVSFDPNIRWKLWGTADHRPLLRRLALEADIVLMGLSEAEELFGRENPGGIFEILFREGKAERAAIKNGGEGAWVASREAMMHIPPYPAACVDPIGAGDAFNAGFLCGVLEGRSLEECGRMGAVAGAMAVGVPGDIEGLPSREALQRRLDRTDIQYR